MAWGSSGCWEESRPPTQAGARTPTYRRALLARPRGSAGEERGRSRRSGKVVAAGHSSGIPRRPPPTSGLAPRGRGSPLLTGWKGGRGGGGQGELHVRSGSGRGGADRGRGLSRGAPSPPRGALGRSPRPSLSAPQVFFNTPGSSNLQD